MIKTKKFTFQKQNQNHSVILKLINCHSLLGFRFNEYTITLPNHNLYHPLFLLM